MIGSFVFVVYLRSKSKCSSINVQNVNCDNQEKALLYQCPPSEKFSLIPSSRMQSMDLMTNIQFLINDRLVKDFYHFFFFFYSIVNLVSIEEFSRTKLSRQNS